MDTVDTRIIAMLPHLTVEQKERLLKLAREMAMFETTKKGNKDSGISPIENKNECLYN